MPAFSTYSEFERMEREVELKKAQLDLETARCPKCDSQWFEEVRVGRYQAHHQVIPGQNIPLRKGSQLYVLMRCIHCGTLSEPSISRDLRDPISGEYDHLLDTIEGKFDQRKINVEKL